MLAIVDRVGRGLGPWFHSTVTEHIDPRSRDWLCVSPLVPCSVIAAYLLLVKWWGPRFMARRPAFQIEPVIIAYNALQIAACLHVFWAGLNLIIKHNYSLTCQPVDPAMTADNDKFATLVFTYYMIKITDLLDTVFFVLRKKFNHVSFLHVYHHAGMVFVSYLACIFSLNGHFMLLGIINSFVHVVMYAYYLVTALLPDKKPSLAVKKSLTTLQLAQFSVLLVHEALPLFQPACAVQKVWCALLVVQYTGMIAMFSDFYIKAYHHSPPKKSA